jgi:ABC-type antimicrobial peptide transport system permease subunit
MIEGGSVKSFWSLIPKYIFSNKKRISFIAVGIVFSISLIIALNIMLDSLTKSSVDEMIKFVGGDYDIVCQRADENVIDTLNKDTDIEKKTVVAYLGQSKIPDTIYSIELNGYEPNVTEIFNFKLSSGRYPKNNNEIALESWIVENMPQKFKIGDKIKLQTKKTIKNNKGKWEDIFLNHEFILVGTFNYIRGGENLTNIAEGYIAKGYVESIFPPKDIMYSEYFTINPKYTIMEIYEGLSQIPSFKNNEFHMNYFKVDLQQILKSMEFISLILYIIICIVASVIIYNIFSFSVTERVREFGMLRAIGASTRDIKALVLGEGLIIGVIFIPIGIIFGNIAVKLIIAAVSGYKNNSNLLQTPKTGLIASIIVGFASILIGVYLPSRKAGKISAIEAINSNNNPELQGKKIKESIGKNDKIYNVFGLSPVMAKINLRRNKNRFTTTIVSLSICITMFLMVSYIINCTDPLMNIKENLGGDFIIYSNEYNDECSLYNDDIKKITDIKGITKINKVKFVFLQMKVAPDKVTQSGIDFLGKKAKENTYSQDDLKHEVYKFNTEVYGYSKEDLELIKNSLKEGKIDIDKMQNDPIVILGQNLNYGNNTNLKVGDKINLYIPVSNGEYIVDYDVKTFTIGAMLKSDTRTRDASLNNMVIMSDKLNESYNITKGYQIVKINAEKDSYDNVEKSLREIVKYKRVVQLKTYKEELEKAKKQYLQFSLIMYSFVIIAALVSIINLINIMNMNVVLRKRELGMLRSQGFSRGEIRSMINTEGLLYGLISSAWGIGLGLVFSYLFFLISRRVMMQGMTWKLPLGTVLGTFAAVIIICVLAAMNSTRRVFNSSIIDSVRTID